MGSCCIHRGELCSWLMWLLFIYFLQKLLGHSAAESHAFGRRIIPGNSQMPEHERRLPFLPLLWASRGEILRLSLDPLLNAMCWSMSRALGLLFPPAPGAAVLQGWSASFMGQNHAVSWGLIPLAKAPSDELEHPKHPGLVRETPCSQVLLCLDKRKMGTCAIPGNHLRNIITPSQAAFAVTCTEENVPGCRVCSPWGVPCQTCIWP